METNDPHRLLRAKQVAEMTGLSVSTFYAQIRRGVFPKPLQTGPNTVAWRYGDIIGWINSLQEVAR
ncbi:AlpA family phage regulatory protein [Pseudotabrizicola sp. 4114]|uniref:helix-turn-helix transcriptional regulator n=1 Tax=Pseudotabrizicola sp. 4114 TaxID=2817731 RepID=UPI0028664B0A|nr:prophage regulatory protein [Pseudorhodobacter sp. 4114]